MLSDFLYLNWNSISTNTAPVLNERVGGHNSEVCFWDVSLAGLALPSCSSYASVNLTEGSLQLAV